MSFVVNIRKIFIAPNLSQIKDKYKITFDFEQNRTKKYYE